MSFLLHWPLWASALLVYALFLAVALGLVFVVGRWVRRQPARETVVGGLVPPVGAAMTAGFLVWMALLANTEVRDIDDAERAVHAEAAALHALGGWAAPPRPPLPPAGTHSWPTMPSACWRTNGRAWRRAAMTVPASSSIACAPNR